MFIVNINKCHFIIYSSYELTRVIFEESYDKEFVKATITGLKEIYFSKMLCYFDQ